MEEKIDFATFEEKAQELIKRLAVIDELFTEADDLIISLDYDNLDDDQRDDAWDLAWEIKAAFGAEMDSFQEGMWMPSTC